MPKIHLRLVLELLLDGTAISARSILDARKAPAFFAARGRTSWLRDFVEQQTSKDAMARSRFAPFARDAADLFWIRSIEVLFLRHRGHIDGMTFEDLAAEVMSTSLVRSTWEWGSR